MLWLDPRPHMRRQSCRRLGQVAPEARSRPWGSAIPARPGQRPTRFATCLRGGDRLRGQMESVNRPGRPRIMVIARGHLGDIVTALPALRDLRAGYPDAHIALVANEYVRGALEGCPFVDEILYGFGYRHRSALATGARRPSLLTPTAGGVDIRLSSWSRRRSRSVLARPGRARRRPGSR